MVFWIVTFLSVLFLGFKSASIFGPKLQLWENAILLVRKHTLNQQLDFGLESVYKIYSYLGNLIVKLDKFFPLFPTSIKLYWWNEKSVYLFISLPIIIILVSLIVLFRKRKIIILIGFVLIFFWLVPVPNITKISWDKLITKTHWSWKYPWSESLVWVWRHGDDNNTYPYTSFKYQWNQKESPSTAKVLISSLGDYQLIINGESLYHGPSYAVLPTVYYDQIDISKNIKKGKNEIIIICNYSNEKHHQHVTYPTPGLLIGGEIKDGIITRNLADNRLWQTARNNDWKNGVRISMDSGYSENFDLTKENSTLWEVSQKLDFDEYLPQPRPLPLLVEKIEPVNEMNSGMYDFGKTMVGYLTAKGFLDESCTLSVSWGDKLMINKSVQGNSQEDKLIFSKGEINWEQFSRRAGRYIQIDKSTCEGKIKLGFKTIGMPIIEPKIPKFTQEIDQEIYQLGINTLKNNVQDHFEDSIVREKAMYIGDAREISRCLMVDGNNVDLVGQMIKQFSQAQNEDGSLPSMTPSGNPVIIYDYVFQWVLWADEYITKTKDISFAKEIWPSVEKIMAWSKKNESSEGFLNNNWWVFIDWTPIDRSKQFVTSLQLWHYQSLRSAASIAKVVDRPEEEFTQRADKILVNLLKYGYNKQTGLFVDSFSLEEQSRGESLITNALAGLIKIFPNEKSEDAIKNFEKNLYTSDPFSESWVIEWLITVDRKDLALKTMRNYWGGMIKNGATAIYEYYTPGIQKDPASHSHAWGCGPIYLYKKILN